VVLRILSFLLFRVFSSQISSRRSCTYLPFDYLFIFSCLFSLLIVFVSDLQIYQRTNRPMSVYIFLFYSCFFYPESLRWSSKKKKKKQISHWHSPGLSHMKTRPTRVVTCINFHWISHRFV
jgi:hypothetical protein